MKSMLIEKIKINTVIQSVNDGRCGAPTARIERIAQRERKRLAILAGRDPRGTNHTDATIPTKATPKRIQASWRKNIGLSMTIAKLFLDQSAAL